MGASTAASELEYLAALEVRKLAAVRQKSLTCGSVSSPSYCVVVVVVVVVLLLLLLLLLLRLLLSSSSSLQLFLFAAASAADGASRTPVRCPP